MPDALLYLQSPSRTRGYIMAQIKSAHNLLCALNDTTVCRAVCCLHVWILFKLSGLLSPRLKCCARFSPRSQWSGSDSSPITGSEERRWRQRNAIRCNTNISLCLTSWDYTRRKTVMSKRVSNKCSTNDKANPEKVAFLLLMKTQ